MDRGCAVTRFAQDCTTLGGNSESAGIDRESGLVVDFHFVGDHLVSGYAVPSWDLAADRGLAQADIQFG